MRLEPTLPPIPQVADVYSSEMIYLKWTPSELATLEMRALYTEVDEDGWVQRELGVDDEGIVTHQLVPSTGRPGWFGLARLATSMLASHGTQAELESLGDAGVAGARAQ